jgi:hypothetical protein
MRPENKKETYELIKDVETRWNSFYYSAERACYLRNAIDELLMEEHTEYERYRRRCLNISCPVKQQPPAILKDMLSADDWAVITRYVEILKPLKDATVTLEGHIGGRFGAIWRVLPLYEKILQHFEDLVQQYPVDKLQNHLSESLIAFDDSNTLTADSLLALPTASSTAEHHFSLNIKLAWQKLDNYYDKLDNNPLYIAAIVLHPRMKWKWFDKSWHMRPEWIKKAKYLFNTLLVEYEQCAVAEQRPEKTVLSSPLRPLKRQRRLFEDSSSDDDDSEASETPVTIQQQLVSYQTAATPKELSSKETPVPYWLSKRQDWPHLARLALDVYSVPVMSDEPERVFSITGAAITPRRRLLKSEKIGYLMCLKAWIKAGVVSLDR